MTVYVNTSVHARTWLRLQDPETGRTLRLQPGEEVELDLPDEFEDAHLKPKAQPSKRSRSKAAKDTDPEPAGESDDTTTEE